MIQLKINTLQRYYWVKFKAKHKKHLNNKSITLHIVYIGPSTFNPCKSAIFANSLTVFRKDYYGY